MKYKVYYNDIDGELQPMWMILPANVADQSAFYSLNAPFERFYPEDFYDEMKSISISQGELLRSPTDPYAFGISHDLVKRFLMNNGQSPELLYEVDYFIVRIVDLEELMQMDVRRIFLEEIE